MPWGVKSSYGKAKIPKRKKKKSVLKQLQEIGY